MNHADEWRALAARRNRLRDLTDEQFSEYIDGLRAWQRRLIRQFWPVVVGTSVSLIGLGVAAGLVPAEWASSVAILSAAVTLLMGAHIYQALLFRSCLKRAEADNARREEEARERWMDERRIKATSAIRRVIRAEDHHANPARHGQETP